MPPALCYSPARPQPRRILAVHTGVGKSFLFYPSGRNTPIIRTIYGGSRGFDNSPYMGAGDVSQLTAKFNLTHGGKLVAVLDEVGQKSTRAVMVRACSACLYPFVHALLSPLRGIPHSLSLLPFRLTGPAKALGWLRARAN